MGKKAFLYQVLLSIGLFVGLTACNFPAVTTPTESIDVTQAYQTVAANLTEAVTRTPKLTNTLIPTESGLSPPTLTPSPDPSPTEAPLTPSLPAPCDLAAAGNPIDVTIPDDTPKKPGDSFTKIWSLVNAGTCAWTADYAVVWFSGEMMSAPSSIPLEVTVNPGDAVEITVDMVAPTTSGAHQGNWKLRNAAGFLFGIGPNGDAPFWVRIVVVDLPTNTPEPSPEPTATSTVSPTPGVHVSGTIDLIPDDQLDLDTILLAGDDSADLRYDSAGELALTPLQGALISTFGPGEPTPEDCQNTSLGSNALPIKNLLPGTYLCYRTNQDRFGWAQLTNLDGGNFTLSLALLTWGLP